MKEVIETNVFLYTITIIATSVILSTILNIVVMKVITGVATKELEKMEKRLITMVEMSFREDN